MDAQTRLPATTIRMPYKMTDHAEWWTFAANAQVEEPVAQAVPILRLAISLSMPFSMMAHASIPQQDILVTARLTSLMLPLWEQASRHQQAQLPLEL